MDRFDLEDFPLAPKRGRTYGDTSIGGNANVVVGDVHIGGQVTNDQEKRELQRKGKDQSLLTHVAMSH